MLKKILAGVAGLIVIFLVVVMAQPSEYHVERTAQIVAPAEVVWAEISNFQQWNAWSHWAKSDPQQKTTVTGEPGTVGHTSSWKGEKTGEGTMSITEATKPTHLSIHLDFKTPMEGQAETAFDIAAKGDMVDVTWSMDGKNGFMGKLFGLLMGMEEMIGSAYDEGLANIKQIAEEKAKTEVLAAAAADAQPSEEKAAAPAE